MFPELHRLVMIALDVTAARRQRYEDSRYEEALREDERRAVRGTELLPQHTAQRNATAKRAARNFAIGRAQG